jgi:hypothetical protein
MAGWARTILAGLAGAWLASGGLLTAPAGAQPRSDPAAQGPQQGPQLHRILYSGRAGGNKVSGQIILQADATWLETNQARSYSFQEVSRTATTLLLNDPRRHLQLRVELAEHRIYWSTGDRWNSIYQVDAVE